LNEFALNGVISAWGYYGEFQAFLVPVAFCRANLIALNRQHRQLLQLVRLSQLLLKHFAMNFPHPYIPLRPQTTIAIDQVKTTNSETQPNVKIAIAVLLILFTNNSYIYHNFEWNWSVVSG
jgi:hypothetical protein